VIRSSPKIFLFAVCSCSITALAQPVDPALCAPANQKSADQLAPVQGATNDKTPPPNASPILNGRAEQQEIIDPPFGEVPGFIETEPVKGRASAFNWLLLPLVGQGTFEHWMQNAHPDFSLSAEKNDPNMLVEMVGEHETIGPKGYICGINCRRVKMEGAFLQANTIRRFLAGRPPRVLVYEVNCSCSINNPEAVRQFVKDGGYLIVTGRDMNGVQQAFPGRIASANGALSCDQLVDAQLVRPDQVLGTNLVSNARWYVPAQFATIKVLNRQAVRILCVSQQLAEDIPDGQGVLAAMFPYGRGYVLCLVGVVDNSTGNISSDSGVAHHNMHKQLPDPAPKIHISLRQGIAANFIEAGLTRKRIPTGISPALSQAP
jgi:hypothetical protein